jgi:hypothetical protein
VGGELHFARLANGAWIVRRWFLRVPVTGRPAGPVTTDGSAPWVLVRPATTSLGEEGAEVTTDELRAPVLPATISGVLRDSTGKRALAGAVVRIGGATRTVVPDSAGRFTIDALAPGPIALLATSASYDSLGIAAADLSLELASGEVRRIALTARDARATTMRLCNGEAAPFGHGTVHLVVRDSASGAPLAGAAATLRWMSAAGPRSGRSCGGRKGGDERRARDACRVRGAERTRGHTARDAGDGVGCRDARARDSRPRGAPRGGAAGAESPYRMTDALAKSYSVTRRNR